jgi:carbon storage regulator
MLVLTRKQDEKIVIDDDIEIVIVEVRGRRVRLGIAAPKGVRVHRKEIYEKIKKEIKRPRGRKETA